MGGKTHGMSRTPAYSRWSGIKKRCNNPNEATYKNYGGRGIKVCKRWRKFENFYADMGAPKGRFIYIDRINNDGNYSPKNCRWITAQESSSNRRSNKKITIKGKTMNLTQWCKLLGVRRDTAKYRINTKGMNAAKVLLALHKSEGKK